MDKGLFEEYIKLSEPGKWDKGHACILLLDLIRQKKKDLKTSLLTTAPCRL